MDDLGEWMGPYLIDYQISCLEWMHAYYLTLSPSNPGQFQFYFGQVDH